MDVKRKSGEERYALYVCSVRPAETQLTAIRNLRLVKIRPASGQSDLVPRIILSQRGYARAWPGDPCKADASQDSMSGGFAERGDAVAGCAFWDSAGLAAMRRRRVRDLR